MKSMQLYRNMHMSDFCAVSLMEKQFNLDLFAIARRIINIPMRSKKSALKLSST